MTNEQIRQNACEYASIGRGAFQTYEEYAQLRDTYIAGAHSRDEEIESLQRRVSMWKHEAEVAAKELDQLRNPWISVEDRLPEDFHPKIVLTDIGEICNMYYSEDDKKWFGNTISGNVTHWMPIPELQKGGEI